jgi:hypothetical protein
MLTNGVAEPSFMCRWHCRTKVCSAKPRGSYLYVRASAAGSCGIRHQVLGGLPARPRVWIRPPLARYEALLFFEFLQELRLDP